jgi:hypothetical protein
MCHQKRISRHKASSSMSGIQQKSSKLGLVQIKQQNGGFICKLLNSRLSTTCHKKKNHKNIEFSLKYKQIINVIAFGTPCSSRSAIHTNIHIPMQHCWIILYASLLPWACPVPQASRNKWQINNAGSYPALHGLYACLPKNQQQQKNKKISETIEMSEFPQLGLYNFNSERTNLFQLLTLQLYT